MPPPAATWSGPNWADAPTCGSRMPAVKTDYPTHLELAVGLLRRGGLLAVDNVLLSGDVAAGRSRSHWSDQSIAEMRTFNERLLSRGDLDATVLPVGDGVAIAVRR
jgi:predicted O-methyltransferase YrrM